MVQRLLPSGQPLRLVHQGEEHDLVARCVAGDPPALRALFDRERGRVHALLFRVVGSNAQMEDLVQDAFLEIFRSLRGFRGESSLRTWIDRCVVRVAYAHFRRKARVPVLEAVEEPSEDAPSLEERAWLREAVRRLYAELDRLEPRMRLAFTLFAVENRSLREVAELTESTLATAKIRVWRARHALERRAKHDPLLSEYLAGDLPRGRQASP